MTEPATWVTDTSVYTHLSRAGHLDLLHEVAPGGVIVVPNDVNTEIQAGRDRHTGITDPATTTWAQVTVLTDDEVDTQLEVKAALGGGPFQHLGECAVIACAQHRGHVALLDDQAAIVQADARAVPNHTTLWLVVEAYTTVFQFDRNRAIEVVDDLIGTDMYLPFSSGQSLFAWAYEKGYLPKT